MHRQLLALLIAAVSLEVSAAVPNLDVRTVRSTFNGLPVVSFQVSNQGTTAVDSFALRVFLNARDTSGTHTVTGISGLSTVFAPFPTTVGIRFDICVVYDVKGFNHTCEDSSYGTKDFFTLSTAQAFLEALPVGDTDANGVRAWAFDIPFGALRLAPGTSLRTDILFGDRSEYSKAISSSQKLEIDSVTPFLPDRILPSLNQVGWWDLLNSASQVPSLGSAWSFSSATDSVASSGKDSALLRASTNAHVLVRRLGTSIWGFAPDGSGPGLPAALAVLDSGSVLPYAPIAAPRLSGGDRRTLDSAFVRLGRVRVNQAGYRLSDVTAGRARVRYFGTETRFRVVPVNAGGVTDSGALQSLGFTVTASAKAVEYLNSMTQAYAISSDSLKTSLAAVSAQEGTLPATLPAGRYRVIVGSDTSPAFQVSDSLYGWVRDAAVRFLGVQRSGDSSWFHGAAHMSDGSLAGASGAYSGGWYDAGDFLKEPQTMASTLAQLSALAATAPQADADHWGAIHSATAPLDGVPDVLKEARHGADFFLTSWQRNGSRTETDTVAHIGMVTGIGDFSKEHSWWGRPEMADVFEGTSSRTVRSELGANTLGDVAASLALLSRLWRPRDAVWADTALAAAKEMYAWAKKHPDRIASSSDYNGVMSANANLALASVALLWATRDTGYLYDLAYNKLIGTHGNTSFFSNSSFEGGWLVAKNSNLSKGAAVGDWASRHAVALYAFARLILLDKDSALAMGVRDETERELLLTRVLSGMQQNLASLAGSTTGFALPSLDASSVASNVGGDASWGLLYNGNNWAPNNGYASEAAELLFYADIAAAVREGTGGTTLSAKSWPVDGAVSMALRHLDYLLGINPWGTSFVAGVGTKTMNHPHHRTANPEGISTIAASYTYTVPVGALYGGATPSTAALLDSWQNYNQTEPFIDGAVQLLTAAVLLAPKNSTTTIGTSIHGGVSHSMPRLAVIAQAHRIEARLSGLDANAAVRAELLDIRGRVLASAAKTAGADGSAALVVSSTGHGLAILRVRSASFERSQSVVLP